MKLYTKTGDKGKTGLIGGTRVNKNDIRLEAYGTVDELNAQVGMLAAMNIPEEDKLFLEQMQNTLFVLGSHLATDTSKTNYNEASVIKDEFITNIEKKIDEIDAQLPTLTRFILPGGSKEAAQSHICRTVARRAERRIVEMNNVYPVDNKLIVYVNRLSDYFFALARQIIMCQGIKEIYWNSVIY